MSRNRLPDAREVAIPEIPVEERLTVDADRAALVVVDMQKDFVRPDGALYVEAAEETVGTIRDLIGRARDGDIPVVFTQDTHREDDREFAVWPPHCIEGTKGWEIIDELPVEKADLVVRKNRYDAFYGTPLEHYLAHVWNVEQLIIVGTVANICVGQTAASAGLRWYQIVTPANGISALTDFDHASALRQISMLYNGTVVAEADDLIFTDR